MAHYLRSEVAAMPALATVDQRVLTFSVWTHMAWSVGPNRVIAAPR
ncbi:hypothetical protein L838_3154 [Mycobacterium avium MAV_120709_2344]|nr:hypothetical protein L838_3154 [Mycobacterium avium MAV_120709_2344]